MDLFRLVSDCILYCRTVEKQRYRMPGEEVTDDTMVAGCTEDLANAMQMLLCVSAVGDRDQLRFLFKSLVLLRHGWPSWNERPGLGQRWKKDESHGGSCGTW